MAAKKTSPEEYASDADVELAIRSLTAADGFRLQKFSAFRARGIEHLGLGLDGNDLLQEAIASTLTAGGQRWRKTVRFVNHLMAAIRNRTGHIRRDMKDFTFAGIDDDPGASLGDALPSEETDGVTLAAAHQQLARIEKRFEDDVEVGCVMEELALGKTGSEIQRDLNLSEKEYETIIVRLRRGIDRKEGWRP